MNPRFSKGNISGIRISGLGLNGDSQTDIFFSCGIGLLAESVFDKKRIMGLKIQIQGKIMPCAVDVLRPAPHSS